MSYKPIDHYGLIGDMHSAALVASDGSIDWCCLPHFDSPSLFAAILDHQKGGYFRISALDAAKQRQMYLPETNVLVTRFLDTQGVGEVTDFMPVVVETLGQTAPTHQIVRNVQCVRGQVRFRLECFPAFDYARRSHETVLCHAGAVFESGSERVALVSPLPLQQQDTGVVAEFTLKAGECRTFVLRRSDNHTAATLLTEALPGPETLQATVNYWKRWMSHCTYDGRWREMVTRSALVLKLLTFQPTGAIVAAPTCGLPEDVGGVRNWDYRYTWIRDAAFTIYAFMRLGYTEEAAQFMGWLQKRIGEEEQVSGPLNIMYGIDGRHHLPEQTLDHLEGYRCSRPVRIGNGAAHQLQLDIYGELMDSVYLFDKYGSPVHYDQWRPLQRMLDWVSQHWNQPDEGIWEVRGGRQHFVYSKMQCWVALDRGLRLAQKRSLPLDRARLLQERDRIYEAIMEHGWSEERQAFVQYFGSDSLDAANLMMPLMLFISPTDPRMRSTIDRTMTDLVSDSTVYRYEIGHGAKDGLSGGEGTFSICTFWLVEALTRTGRIDEARLIFEKMLTYANHLGLYSEEIGPCGELLGNFPQAFTHLGLISAAYNLDRTLSGEHKLSV